MATPLTTTELAELALLIEESPSMPTSVRVDPYAYAALSQAVGERDWPAALTEQIRRLSGLPGLLGQIPIIINYDMPRGAWKVLGRHADDVLASGQIDHHHSGGDPCPSGT